MKIAKFNENLEESENKLKNDFLEILNAELFTEEWYGMWSVSGKEAAVECIIKYLEELGIDFDVYMNTKKYNI